MQKFVIGIDEAGRAPLAGPVSVGFVKVPENFDVLKELPGTRDSKKLSEAQREAVYSKILERKRNGDIQFAVRYSDHLYIDEHGITKAVKRAIISGTRYLAKESHAVKIFLDGLLHAPSHFAQETIIRGDNLVPVISLASIVAKVERDHLMKRMAKLYPHYNFERHKGYPTKAHYAAIAEHGLCDIHRRSFLQAG